VVGISDFGQLEDGTSYFVMEYLDGPTLSRFIKEHAPMDVALIREIALQIGEGLAAAHAQQIVHRDLKPDNVTVMARPDRPVFCKILDFGIAKVLSGTTSGPRTLAGSVIGTPYYMPPEQVEGEEVDARSDLYSLGVVLFEMATGRRPFNQSSAAAVMHSHKYDAPPSIRELRRGQPLPGALEEIILCLMAKDRRERFQSANELIEALRAIAGEGAAGASVEGSMPRFNPTTPCAPPPPPARAVAANRDRSATPVRRPRGRRRRRQSPRGRPPTR
jgi:serine/threonine-protein kinase